MANIRRKQKQGDKEHTFLPELIIREEREGKGDCELNGRVADHTEEVGDEKDKEGEKGGRNGF